MADIFQMVDISLLHYTHTGGVLYDFDSSASLIQ